jgi:hypothetical protein
MKVLEWVGFSAITLGSLIFVFGHLWWPSVALDPPWPIRVGLVGGSFIVAGGVLCAISSFQLWRPKLLSYCIAAPVKVWLLHVQALGILLVGMAVSGGQWQLFAIAAPAAAIVILVSSSLLHPTSSPGKDRPPVVRNEF